jgi:ethanolamine utilization microcompartment shell protein EutS
MSENPLEHRLALDNEPELAQQVGLILSAFAILELSPAHMMSKLTGISHADADIALGHFRNFGNRLDLIRSLASVRDAMDQGVKEILGLLPLIRECSVIRNKYAHSLWQMESDGQRTWWRLISWLPDATRQTQSTFVTKDSIKADCAKVRATFMRQSIILRSLCRKCSLRHRQNKLSRHNRLASKSP